VPGRIGSGLSGNTGAWVQQAKEHRRGTGQGPAAVFGVVRPECGFAEGLLEDAVWEALPLHMAARHTGLEGAFDGACIRAACCACPGGAQHAHGGVAVDKCVLA
jgi:hypothetical protein